ncbi:MAG: hypothetical protein K2M48_05755, partial [Clostridiales bacterium]|nr:hypothetical protein [Clostridiales bacterium]
MKKRITFVLAMLLALVMSFALMACGDPDGQKTPPPDKGVVVQKALTSLGEYAGANVQKGKLDYTADTAETDKKSGSVEFTRNGTDVYYKLGTDEVGVERLLDTRTGLKYTKKNNKWSYAGTAYQQGLVDYGMDVIAGILEGDDEAETLAATDGEFSLDDIEYNAKTNTLSVHVDVAEQVNRPLGPIQEVYDGGSVKSLIDAYLREYYSEIVAKLPIIKVIGKPITVDKIATYFKLELVRVKDEPLVDYVESLTKTNIKANYEEYLKQRGLTDDRLETAKTRKVGEAIEGALAYI